jgi:hypothetical protein
MFLDGPAGRPSSAIHIVYANEKVKPEHGYVAPDLAESERAADFQVATLPALVRMKLTSFRLVDRVHVRDLIDVGLIDNTWPSRFPAQLKYRLQQLLDDPNG